MHDDGLIDRVMFTLCLGRNGGYFQIGGFDGTGFIEAEPTWVTMLSRNSDFLVTLNGMSMNNHYIVGSNESYRMMIDSGTTFTYFPRPLYNLIESHFKWFCAMDPKANCKGKMKFDRPGYMCWEVDVSQFKEGVIEFYRSMPILRFHLEASPGQKTDTYSYDWYPSEYLYNEKINDYCVAADIQSNNI